VRRLPACEDVSSEAERPQLNQLGIAVVRSEKLVTKVEDISETQRKGNVCRWELLPSNGQ
jgi:hypothetical protein